MVSRSPLTPKAQGQSPSCTGSSPAHEQQVWSYLSKDTLASTAPPEALTQAIKLSDTQYWRESEKGVYVNTQQTALYCK